MKKNKGFTLIELLVVIAIIGILASVVLASLSNARDKGKDAAVKSQLASMKAQAELYFSASESYEDVCLTANTNNINGLLVAAANSSATATTTTPLTDGTNAVGGAALVAVCNDGIDGWAVSVPLSNSKFYCADNTGLSAEVSTGLVTTSTTCPTS